ncbi:MAG: c-type cytochrome [Terriglobales bacterium]
MKRTSLSLVLVALTFSACSHRQQAIPAPKASAYGTAIVLSSGDKQLAGVGNTLSDPVVVQVNDRQGNGVTGAPVSCSGPNGAVCNPASGLTDSSGQFTTTVSVGGMSGRYLITASTQDAAGKHLEVKIDEIALGYQQTLGHELNEQYCGRCHNPESTAARVSNFDNLTTKPHAFNEGDTLNKMSNDDLMAIISHGGPALSKSAEMPPFGYTLTKSDIQALIAYIRAVSDPPYRATGVVYAKAQ